MSGEEIEKIFKEFPGERILYVLGTSLGGTLTERIKTYSFSTRNAFSRFLIKTDYRDIFGNAEEAQTEYENRTRAKIKRLETELKDLKKKLPKQCKVDEGVFNYDEYLRGNAIIEAHLAADLG